MTICKESSFPPVASLALVNNRRQFRRLFVVLPLKKGLQLVGKNVPLPDALKRLHAASLLLGGLCEKKSRCDS